MKRILLLTCMTLTVLSARDVVAGPPGWWPYGWGGVYSPSVRGLPPYFSIFPPVYYSYPVPRTYGYSPYAYPPGTPTPEVTIETPQARLMINPYAPRLKPSVTSQPEKTAGPLTIVNPYVEPRIDLARDVN